VHRLIRLPREKVTGILFIKRQLYILVFLLRRTSGSEAASFNLAEASAKAQMQSFVRSSGPVILYIEDLFTSRNLGLDW
jgi:hypothetical protein